MAATLQLARLAVNRYFSRRQAIGTRALVLTTPDIAPDHRLADGGVQHGIVLWQVIRRLPHRAAAELAADDSLELFLEHFPTVMREDAVEFLKLAREDDPAR